MTRKEVIRKIEEASEAIKEYKKDGLDKIGPFTPQSDRDDIDKIEKGSRSILKETYNPGASGDRCDCCGGSGRRG